MPIATSHVVTSTALNLRSSPGKQADNLIATLPQGHGVQKRAAPAAGGGDTPEDTHGWWRVQTDFKGHTLEGFLHSSYLQTVREAPPLPILSKLASIHLAGRAGRRGAIDARANPLGEPDLPRRDPLATPAIRVSSLHTILRFLDVERSARYQPTPSSTFCNVYAYDYCYLARAYLPRVWWSQRAVLQLNAGNAVTAAYGSTIFEQTANQLFDWLNEWGDEFGWVRVFDLSLLQDRANDGNVGLICAQRKVLSRSGHITVVIPEVTPASALRSSAHVTIPLQSQAGVRNRQSFTRDWWVQMADNFRDTGFWYHDPARAALS